VLCQDYVEIDLRTKFLVIISVSLLDEGFNNVTNVVFFFFWLNK
jgi:hypothetical protein